ncbi:hypothetical protein [Paracoccus sp. Ld10]|uniref:hypothetical protein n=1 Tax=Paracoccus sp. Ld10 TaxID=649158 RepID=UPI003869DA3F
MIPARIARDPRRYGTLIALARLRSVVSIIIANFPGCRTIVDLPRQRCISGILVIKTTFVILIRDVSLSVGSVMALVGVVSANTAMTSGGACSRRALSVADPNRRGPDHRHRDERGSRSWFLSRHLGCCRRPAT